MPQMLSTVLFVLATCGCVNSPLPRDDAPIEDHEVEEIRAKLARVGLIWISAAEAALPAEEAERFLAVVPSPRVDEPALPHHPSGYLLVGVDRKIADDRSEILRALRAWEPSRPVLVSVRRNPHLAIDVDWWEADVRLALPR